MKRRRLCPTAGPPGTLYRGWGAPGNGGRRNAPAVEGGAFGQLLLQPVEELPLQEIARSWAIALGLQETREEKIERMFAMSMRAKGYRLAPAMDYGSRGADL